MEIKISKKATKSIKKLDEKSQNKVLSFLSQLNEDGNEMYIHSNSHYLSKGFGVKVIKVGNNLRVFFVYDNDKKDSVLVLSVVKGNDSKDYYKVLRSFYEEINLLNSEE